MIVIYYCLFFKIMFLVVKGLKFLLLRFCLKGLKMGLFYYGERLGKYSFYL